MKQLIFKSLFVALMALTSISVFSQNNSKTATAHATGKDISVQEADKLIKAGGTIVLDVRTKGEYNNGHIKNSININWYDPKFAELTKTLDKSKPVVVYCAAGSRSAEAKEALLAAGFKSVLNMKDGFEGWEEQKMPVEK